MGESCGKRGGRQNYAQGFPQSRPVVPSILGLSTEKTRTLQTTTISLFTFPHEARTNAESSSAYVHDVLYAMNLFFTTS